LKEFRRKPAKSLCWPSSEARSLGQKGPMQPTELMKAGQMPTS